MNTYSYADLFIGQTEAFSVTITDEMMESFNRISGDVNPMHLSDDYAKTHGFSGRIVYGMLTASFYSTLAGVYLPGERCLLQEVHTEFSTPVYVDDTLTVTGEITEKLDAYKRVTVKARIKNQDGKTVSKAKVKAGVRFE